MSRHAVVVDDLTKAYLGAPVLRGVSLATAAGDLTLLTGPSGSGKTTLLNLVTTLDTADGGSITVGDIDVRALAARDRVRFRADLGHVFQRSGLIRGLTARENIEVGHALTGHATDPRWVSHLASRLGIDHLLETRAGLLSGGEAQRVAVVRALAHRPDFVFADEPTASLDSASKHTIHALFKEAAEQWGTTVLLVSHDEISPHYAHAVLTLADGRLA